MGDHAAYLRYLNMPEVASNAILFEQLGPVAKRAGVSSRPPLTRRPITYDHGSWSFERENTTLIPR